MADATEKDPEANSVVGKGPNSVPHWKLVFEHGFVTPEVLKWQYDGEGTEESPYVVTWIENDPRNPMLFSQIKKWSITMLSAFATLAVAFVSSAFSGPIQEIIQTFHASEEVVTLGISLFVLGFAIGPLFWAPLSELYGRQILYFITYGALTAFNAGAAGAQNMWTLIILRFFAGSFGSSPLTNAGGVIADIFPAKERGLALSIFAAAPFMGPVLGPIVGGFLGETEGWRWVEGLMAIFTGVLWIAGTFLIPETYAPVLLRKRAANLSKMTGKVYRSRGDIEQGPTTLGHALSTALIRPWILLLREPIVLLLSIYMAIVYGTLYMLFAAFPIVYQEHRGWSEGIGGLAFLGVAIGMMGAVLYSIWDNRRYVKVVDAHNGFAPPEARLPVGMIGGIAVPIGLIWFAWTNYPSIHFMASIAAGVPFGFGMVLVFLSIMNYLIDAYTIFAASVLAANAVIRSIFGAVFPLFTSYMFQNLGIHWASMIPAFLALACVPFPFLFYKYGPAIRKRCKFAAEADAFMQKIRDQSANAGQSKEQEEEKEQEALDYSYEDENIPAEGSEKDIEKAQPSSSGEEDRSKFERIKTGGSAKRGRTNELTRYESNPYDIDRVNTKESFARSRASSRASRGVRAVISKQSLRSQED
ncbi:putative MFS multidrug transporter [Viridothelium virens]|uniref:Putative MFS multidrug transporter n=1 Tax=Viridothelium virens TaxID=1048519 RepID=A0A6A6HJY3_VIRVR|nr:putative MFS multidrug transporter [Viridothelium virens]